MSNERVKNLIDLLSLRDHPHAYIVSYYLSRFDRKSYQKLSFGNITETHQKIGEIIGIKTSTLKHIRDVFDGVHENSRQGWIGRELRPLEKKVINFFENYSHDEIYTIVSMILNNPKMSMVDLFDSWQSNTSFNETLSNVQEEIYLGKNIKREVNVRDKQKIFREKVLNNFNRCCCLTGETTEELLIASHIIPWSKGEDNRVDPGNGLCLSWVYDKLFDRGYFTLEDDLRIQISPRIKYLSKLHQKLLIDIGQAEIRKPIQYDLNPQCLEFHRKYIFK